MKLKKASAERSAAQKKGAAVLIMLLVFLVTLLAVGCGQSGVQEEPSALFDTMRQQAVEMALTVDEIGSGAGELTLYRITAGSFTEPDTDQLLAEYRYDDPSHPAGLERTFACIFDEESGELLTGKIFAADHVDLHVLPVINEQNCILYLGQSAYTGLTSQYGDLYQISNTEWIKLELPDCLRSENACSGAGIELETNWTAEIWQDDALAVIRDMRDPELVLGPVEEYGLEEVFIWDPAAKKYVKFESPEKE